MILWIPPNGLARRIPVPSKVVSIRSVGQHRYSEAQIILASGLQLGQDFDTNSLQAAGEHIGGSGAFEDVQYRFRPEGTCTAVEFTVKEMASSKLHRNKEIFPPGDFRVHYKSR